MTYYEWNAEEFALRAGQLFQYLLKRGPMREQCIRLMPRFMPGSTLAAK